ncbi:hypothetical protein KKH23_07205 [Patescibacteria group bacterium]|nr:hypothetical protein [Patescibacteria group bacterium]
MTTFLKRPCGACNGVGTLPTLLPHLEPETCSYCGGTGDMIEDEELCPPNPEAYPDTPKGERIVP